MGRFFVHNERLPLLWWSGMSNVDGFRKKNLTKSKLSTIFWQKCMQTSKIRKNCFNEKWTKSNVWHIFWPRAECSWHLYLRYILYSVHCVQYIYTVQCTLCTVLWNESKLLWSWFEPRCLIPCLRSTKETGVIVYVIILL